MNERNTAGAELKQSPFTLGIIGYGNIGKVHYDVLNMSDQIDFQVRGIADTNARLSTDIVPFYSDYRKLLEQSDIQAVSINTPPNTHYQLVMDALNAGKHVLVEKPPALTVEQCREMETLALIKRKVLFMSFHARYNPAVEAAKKELAGKNVSGVDIQYSEYALNYHAVDGWIFDPKIAGGGVLIDSGINALSIVTYVLPDGPLFKVRSAQFEKTKGFKVDTKAHVEFLFGDQGTGMLRMDWLNKNPEVRQVTFSTNENQYTVDIVKNKFSKNGQNLFTLDPLRKAVDQISEYERVYQDFARHLTQEKSLISMKELAFVQEAYRKGKI